MSVERRLRELGIDLPAAPAPVGAYVPVVRTGALVFTSGQIPLRKGRLIAAGKVGTDVMLEQAQEAAWQCLLNALAALRAELGSLDKVSRVVRLNVFVNSAPGFVQQAQVANAASDLLLSIFGEQGRHTRTAIGAAELPLGAAVELDLVVEAR